MVEIIVTVLLTCLVFIFYLLRRNVLVYNFKIRVCHLSDDYSKKHGGLSGWKYYDKLPSYEKMLFSFKPLRLKNYFTQEELTELLTNN